jgi:hypothetical protein
MMRINLANPVRNPQAKLVKHWCQLFATEFSTTGASVLNHIKSGDPIVGEYVVNWLQTQGWKLTWYHVPVPGGSFAPNDYTQYTAISFGFVIDDACEEYLAWRLSNP